MSASPPIVTLLTDFGGSDTYVGQMKGAILSVCRHAQLVDLTHEIAAGDIAAGSLAWSDAVPVFPSGTIHLGVVDPGVGSDRRAIAAEIGNWKFVCPDNGLLTRILQKWPLRRAVQLQNSEFWRDEVSPVFHGRDIFGPLAGHWAAGRDLFEFGPPIEGQLVQTACPVPQMQERSIRGAVIAIDRFGNLRTNILGDMLTGALHDWTIELRQSTIRGVCRYFSEARPGMPLAIIGSHGCLEIAVNQGNAADLLQCSLGDDVLVHWD